jgi:type I restriction enzyme S subunit
MNTWPRVRLGEIITVKHGFAFKGEHFQPHGDELVLTPGNFRIGGGLQLREGKEKFYSGSFPEQFRLSPGDLLLAMTDLTQNSPILGSPLIVPNGGVYLHNQRLGKVSIIDGQKLDRDFAYFLFASDVIRSQLRGSATGSTVRHTAPERIYRTTVALPPVETQRKVASTLTSLDNLIVNNQRRIKLLEEMALRIYREWFVEFEYPGRGDDSMVGSAMGSIPRGWRASTVGESVPIVGGGTPSKTVSEYWEDGRIVWYTPTDLTTADAMYVSNSKSRITDAGLANSSARLFPPGSVMMTSRATIGVVSIATTQAATNQGFITCLASPELGTFHLYFWLLQQRELITSLATGATFKEINKATFRRIPFLLADPRVEREFENVVAPIGSLVQNLLEATRNLRMTRDFLLPRLISGEIDLTDLDIAVDEEAA